MGVQFTKLSVSPEVVQSTGTSETAVMSQNAVTTELNELDTRVTTLEESGSGGSSSGGSERIELDLTLISTTSSNGNGNTTGIFNGTDYPNMSSYSSSLAFDSTYSNLYNALYSALVDNKNVSMKCTSISSGQKRIYRVNPLLYNYTNNVAGTATGVSIQFDTGFVGLAMTLDPRQAKPVSLTVYYQYSATSSYPFEFTLNNLTIG